MVTKEQTRSGPEGERTKRARSVPDASPEKKKRGGGARYKRAAGRGREQQGSGGVAGQASCARGEKHVDKREPWDTEGIEPPTQGISGGESKRESTAGRAKEAGEEWGRDDWQLDGGPAMKRERPKARGQQQLSREAASRKRRRARGGNERVRGAATEAPRPAKTDPAHEAPASMRGQGTESGERLRASEGSEGG